MQPRSDIREAISTAARSLADAGIDSAHVDAELLAAHVAGVDRGRLAARRAAGTSSLDRYRDLVDARARRIPLQHLTGVAPFGAADAARRSGGVHPAAGDRVAAGVGAAGAVGINVHPLIVDLCTGSGALAVALARHRPDATVVAVDDSADALRTRAATSAGRPSNWSQADVTEPDLLPDLDGRVDLAGVQPAVHS